MLISAAWADYLLQGLLLPAFVPRKFLCVDGLALLSLCQTYIVAGYGGWGEGRD
jgi:hypothetical protein